MEKGAFTSCLKIETERILVGALVQFVAKPVQWVSVAWILRSVMADKAFGGVYLLLTFVYVPYSLSDVVVQLVMCTAGLVLLSLLRRTTCHAWRRQTGRVMDQSEPLRRGARAPHRQSVWSGVRSLGRWVEGLATRVNRLAELQPRGMESNWAVRRSWNRA